MINLSKKESAYPYIASALLLCAPFADAQESKRQYGPWITSFAGGVVNQFESDFSDGPGSVSVQRAFIQGGFGYAWDRKTSVSLSLGAGTANYDFSSDASIEGSEPWGRINDYRVSLPVRFAPSEKTSAIVIPSLRTYVESGASKSDGESMGIIGGFSYHFSDTLSLGPGMGWFEDVGDETSIFPIILVDWQITDRWSLNTGRGLAASQGPGVTLNYKIDDKWTTGLSARYEETRFRLKEKPGRNGSVGQDSSAPMLLSLDYSPWPMTNVTAILGVELGGALSLEDDAGREIAKSDVDTAIVAGITFSSRF